MNYTANTLDELRDRIWSANKLTNDSVEHVITLGPNFPLTVSTSSVSPANYGNADLFGGCAFPVILRNVRIVGNGHTINIQEPVPAPPNFSLRHFGVNGKLPSNASINAKLTLENLQLTGGKSLSGGGSIVNDGASSALGGASLVIKGCYIYSNRGSVNGGMLYNGDNAKCRIYNSVIYNNQATGANARGGAIYNSSGATLFVRGTTFRNNTAPTSGLGGAIYVQSGSVEVKHSSFLSNTANGNSTPSMTVYNLSGIVDASWNWWGALTPPAGTPTPYLTNLPKYVKPANYAGENPSLPAESAITINGWNTTGNDIVYGPNVDDVFLSHPSLTPAIKLRARAVDEDNIEWVGFVHPNRPEYLSWILKSSVNPSSTITTGLPDFSPPPNTDYSTALTISHSPLSHLNTSTFYGPNLDHQKGFGFYDTQYAQTSFSRHPGFDFFGQPSMEVMAVAGGIVVGIGRSDISVPNPDTVAPSSWGAVSPGPFNLVIRTGGYFLMYGHMESIDPSVYIGARVGPGAILGKLVSQLTTSGDNNTHLHLEVRMFTAAQMDGSTAPAPVRCRFGRIIKDNSLGSGSVNLHPKPRIAADPMRFVGLPGAGGTVSQTTGRITFTNAKLFMDDTLLTFAYEVTPYTANPIVELKAFDKGASSLAPLDPIPAPACPQFCSFTC